MSVPSTGGGDGSGGGRGARRAAQVRLVSISLSLSLLFLIFVSPCRRYAAQLSAGEFVGLAGHAPPSVKLLSDDELEGFLRRCSSRYVCTQLPRLLYRQMRLYQSVAGGDLSAVDIEHGIEPGASLVTLALPGVPPRQALWRALSVLQIHRIGFLRAQVPSQ